MLFITDIHDFSQIKIIDVIDILLVVYLVYMLYRLIRGTTAINIFIGIFFFYLIWKLVSALGMELLSEILGQFIGVGIIALIIVFQQEIRKFLLMIGTRGVFGKRKRFLFWKIDSFKKTKIYLTPIMRALDKMSSEKTGVLIVFEQNNNLDNFIKSGEIINSDISQKLIENIFFKNSPLHDGAMIISDKRIVSVKCILPVSGNRDFPKDLGLRHRAGVGITEQTDALCIIISEQTGSISYCHGGKIISNLNIKQLRRFIEKQLY